LSICREKLELASVDPTQPNPWANPTDGQLCRTFASVTCTNGRDRKRGGNDAFDVRCCCALRNIKLAVTAAAAAVTGIISATDY